ncbi:PARP-type zinc finger-containing protein [Sphaceloma murrayae]|uniref:PARP-type zinc finger-containing protein n=1 Tax=Sphaceloma murrayae TaxID=2082308 RepID=A0A2K1QRU6_9PEZI|nr:PARP-type zinc finger-containing protein [Sphaceloma murrayae]
MPPKKASSATKRKATAATEPTTEPAIDSAVPPPNKRSRTKDPRASHLYTDDNPSTTLHGTGFKDRATALHTLDLVSSRSLTYQFQTINTMLYRARGHAHKTDGINEAIEVFQKWTEGYKSRKAELRSFPLLSKPKVKEYLERYDEGDFGDEGKETEELEGAEAFARMYVELGPRKRLANTLVDEKHPEKEDWEVRRYKQLCGLVKEGKNWETGQLWIDERGRIPTKEHLRLLFWGWSPSKKA